MKLKEAQMLGILALIAVGIILLSMWGGQEPPETGQAPTAQPPGERAEEAAPESGPQEVALAPDLEELYRELLGPTGSSPEPASAQQETVDIEIGGGEAPPAPPASEEDAIGRVIEEMAPKDIPLNPTEAKSETRQAESEKSSEPKPDRPLTHVVQRGETLSAISRKYYGTVAKWRTILEANSDKLGSPRELRPKMRLTIPVAPGLRARAEGSQSRRQVLAANSSGSEASDRKTHTVRKGDTLYRIALKYYGDGSLYKKILKANRNKLSGPRDLKPGMQIEIP